MKAITLYEPWASLMSIGAKINETRPGRTAHRGDICIHAAKSTVGLTEDLAAAALLTFHSRGFTPLNTLGCIIAVVELWDVQPSENFDVSIHLHDSEINDGNRIIIGIEEYTNGNYEPGRFIYRTRNLRRLATPVPCRGFQCVGWTVPPEVEALVRAQLPMPCSYGCGNDRGGGTRCPQPATHVSTFKGARTKLFWCAEHHRAMTEGLQTPGHGFEKL